MISKDILIKYCQIISGGSADPNLTLVDFSLNEEQRNIINMVNNASKKDKKLANLLEDLKYSNNKKSVIENYFNNEINANKEMKSRRVNVNNYGFVSASTLIIIVETVVLALALVVSLGTK